MNIQKGDLLIVIDWNFDDGWVSGYHKNNPSKIGIFPRNYVCKYDKSKKGKITYKLLYNYLNLLLHYYILK